MDLGDYRACCIDDMYCFRPRSGLCIALFFYSLDESLGSSSCTSSRE